MLQARLGLLRHIQAGHDGDDAFTSDRNNNKTVDYCYRIKTTGAALYVAACLRQQLHECLVCLDFDGSADCPVSRHSCRLRVAFPGRFSGLLRGRWLPHLVP